MTKAKRGRKAAAAWGRRTWFIWSLFVLASPYRVVSSQEVSFQRGDANADGTLDISDGVSVLNFLFLGGTPPACLDALDADDTGQLDISDGIVLFNFLFLGGVPPESPFSACDVDPTPDALGCDEFPPCDVPPPECLGQEDLDQAIEENVPPVICFPPDQPLMVGDFTGSICPSDTAAPDCGGSGEPGCSAVIGEASGSLVDSGANEARVGLHIEGLVEDLVVRVDGLFGATDCSVDIPFTAEAVVPLEIVESPGGERVVAEVGALTLDRETTTVNLTAEGGVICDLFEAAQDLFLDATIDQIEEAADGLLDELRLELVGQTLCSN